ncbi:hypothetical protein NDU88_000906 [Pleurodeles waltl]|uniref:G-protein coupled receptors family 1 profile domain-containing protein n=1 Tax=Pleurodeles waltl TaxID=8319 RepID=A0AAV7M6M0_PLEWA|nr:hypothetical protein NDU88_000906 [Pleurodeles waltl]
MAAQTPQMCVFHLQVMELDSDRDERQGQAPTLWTTGTPGYKLDDKKKWEELSTLMAQDVSLKGEIRIALPLHNPEMHSEDGTRHNSDAPYHNQPQREAEQRPIPKIGSLWLDTEPHNAPRGTWLTEMPVTHMGLKNWTFTNEFILLGVSDQPWMQPWLFVIFLAMYVTTLLGNTTIICIIGSDCRLHTPMYFFLCNFSFVDICLTSVTVPKLLANILSEKKSIYFSGCVAQLFFFLLIVNMESFLLGVMAYDRYVWLTTGAVTLFYGTDIFMYFRPSSIYSLDYDRVVSVMYTIVAPMLNPFIYSLRNKDVKDALKKVL